MGATDAAQTPVGSLRGDGQYFDSVGNPTDLKTFYKHNPSFIYGPMAVAAFTCTACRLSASLAARLEDGRAAPYGWYDTLTYTVFAILTTFAAHGWFCVHAAQERQYQQYERVTRGPDGKRLPAPVEGEKSMNYAVREAPRGASVRSTAALLTSWVYALYPFAAPTTSWAMFIGWTCGLAVYWDLHFFIFHKIAHENPRMYKLFHKLHHFYTAPDVFGAYYVTYQSHFATEQSVLLLAAFMGMPRDVFTWTMFLGTFDTCVKHSGHSVSSVQRGLPMSYETLMTILNPWSLVLGGGSAGEHDWHHEKFTKNYALSFTYLDKLFGSYHKGRAAGEAVGLSRAQKAQKAADHAKAQQAAAACDKASLASPTVELVPSIATEVKAPLDEAPPSPPPSPPTVATETVAPPASAPLAKPVSAPVVPSAPAPSGVASLCVPLAFAYSLLVLAQTKGPQIVGVLHGAAAQAAASQPPEDVAPGTPLLELCEGYAAHHFDSIGNSLHAAGMTAGLVSVALALGARHLSTLERAVSAMWWMPQWYLYAWVGHFGMQKDVPAVFTYGLTPSSFLKGEFCSTMWVYTGAVFEPKPALFWPSAGNVPSAALGAIAVATFAFIALATPPGRLWCKEYHARAAVAAKAKAC